jgi:hypothetical protein
MANAEGTGRWMQVLGGLTLALMGAAAAYAVIIGLINFSRITV